MILHFFKLITRVLPKVLCGFGTSVSPEGYGCLENLGYVCKHFKIFLVIVCSKKQSASWHHFSREIGDKDSLVALRMIRSVKVDDALSQSSPGCPFPLTENSLLLILFPFYATVYALRYNLKSQSWAGGGSPIALFLTHKRSINQVLPALCFIWVPGESALHHLNFKPHENTLLKGTGKGKCDLHVPPIFGYFSLHGLPSSDNHTAVYLQVIRTPRCSPHASRSPSLHVLRGEAVDHAVLQGLLSL